MAKYDFHHARKFSYTFSVAPDEAQPQVVRDLFAMLAARFQLEFTESEFRSFRMELQKAGFTLREIERVPYLEPEAVK